MKRRREDEHELYDEVEAADKPEDWSWRDLPEDLAREFIADSAPRSTLTLRDARVVVDKGLLIDVAFVRLDTRQIAAWWLQSDLVEKE